MVKWNQHNLGGILLLAGIYLLAGALVSQTGYHDQILPLWIPAGIALAAGIHFGFRCLPGVWLGSFSFNLLLPASWNPSLITSSIFLAAFIIATGIYLQALLATWLVKHKTGHPLIARGEKRVFRFIFYVGFSSTLVSASLGTLAIHLLSPQAGSTGLAADWLTWWLGDTFGVLLVTPLLLAVLQPQAEGILRNLQRRLMTLFTGTLLVVLAANQVYLMQVDAQVERHFERDVDILHANMNRLYQQNLADLGKLESRFVHAHGMGPEDFHQATAEILNRNPSVLAYSWDPIISAQEREAFNQTTRQLLDYPEYAVYGESPQPEDPLIPVQFVEPFAENTAALGFNLLSLEDRRRWVIQSQETGRPVATQILNLTQAPDEPGLLILQPVYLNSLDQRSQLLSTEKQLAGFMAGVFTVNRIIDAALALSGLEGVLVSIREEGAEEPFYTNTIKHQGFTPLYQKSFSFDFAQQEWHFDIQAGQTYKALTPGANVLQFQSLLVIISALITGVILGMHNRETTLAHRVKEQTRNLAFQAEHDPLTGLPNRLRLEQELDRFFQQPGHQHLALMFIGLDRFKLINDSLGHLTGDSLLIELAARWMQEFDGVAELYRMGGDEFILLQRLKPSQTTEATQALAQRLLDVTAQPLHAAGMHLQITASAGISFSEQSNQDTNTLIRNADTALHQAKLLGKNRYEIYQASQTTLTRKNFELEQDLRLAINTPQITLHYQPQHQLNTMQLCGLEALVRWEHPTQGKIPPDHFIPLAEETQLIVPLGWQIIDQVCRQISDWQDEGIQAPCVAVNISPQQLLQADFIDQLNILVDAYGLNRYQLELEITETLLHQDPDFAFKQLKSLRLAGYRLALDDFGTGYSSFDRLKYMPLDRLKIDRSFVRDIGKNPKDEAIILAIIGLGKSLELEVLAEGVETLEQQAFLTDNGCNSIQGYLHGRPLPSEQLELSA